MNVQEIFPSKYVKAADLNGKTVTLTIQKAVMEEMGHGAEREKKLVLYFQKATKGMVTNRTNAMTIASLYGPETNDWVGQRISLYPTRVKAFGSIHDTIRVREEIPAQPKAVQPVEEPSIDDAEDVTDDMWEPDHTA